MQVVWWSSERSELKATQTSLLLWRDKQLPLSRRTAKATAVIGSRGREAKPRV